MTTAATLPRLNGTERALGIITRAECIPLDDDTWKVRDTATGSGRWHIATSTSCDCRDARIGTCKHQLAVRQEAQDLAAYSVSWNAYATAQRLSCPDCGAPLKTAVNWVGGRSYMTFLVCEAHVEHRAIPV